MACSVFDESLTCSKEPFAIVYVAALQRSRRTHANASRVTGFTQSKQAAPSPAHNGNGSEPADRHSQKRMRLRT